MTPLSQETEARISRFSLDRRITVLVLFLTAMVVGTIAATRIPVELIPSGYDDPFLMVSVPWEDAPSREVLDKISKPLEEEIATVRGVTQTLSVSRTGRSFVLMWFKYGTDMDIAYRELRDRVERARARFPDDVDHVSIRKDDASGIPVYVLGVALDPEVTDSYNLIQNEIILPLERVDGVASVRADGLVEKEILIELDREKTAASGLNIFDLATELGDDNFTMASGTVLDGQRKLLLRSLARFDNVEQLQEKIVGKSVRLKDIAGVSYAQPDQDFRVRAMSKPAVALLVMKEGDANIRKVSADVAAVVERIEANPRFRDTEMVSLFSQGDVIDEALTTLLGSGAIGGVIAALVLFVFLRRFRLTLIIALGIPLSLLIGLTVMYFSGESLNLLTLLGLMLCVGLLVDNSVVVAENIHRLHREGMERRQACIRGAGDVGLAITMSTLTTIVVFLPVALVDGPAQFFMLRLALPVCVSVGASLIIALVFTPLCVYLTLPTSVSGTRYPAPVKLVHGRINAWLRSFYRTTFERLNRVYARMLGFFLERRLDLVLTLIAVFAVTIAVPMKHVETVDSQEEERGGFYVGVEMPQSTTLDEAEEWFLAAEKVIESKKDELGLEGWFLFHRATYGELQGWFSRPRTVDISPAEATRIVKEALPQKPGFELVIGRGRDSGDEGKGKTTYTVVLNGDDPDQLEQVGDELEQVLVQVDGVLGLQGGNEPPPGELGLVLDRERGQRYGVNPQVVAGVVGYALRGAPLPKYYDDGKEIPVRIRLKEENRESLTELANFQVPTNRGELLPLSSVTEVEFLPTPGEIVRRNERIGRAIVLELEEETAEETRERLTTIVAGIDLPEGISYDSNQQQRNLDDDMAGLRFALVLSIVFIYLLMGFLFESFILPLSIILTIPLSSIGVYWIHLITGFDIDFLGWVAVVLLIGVVVNNGIVMIDYVNRLRSQGHTRHEALLTATDRRFRPIMMTAITTIGGMIPLALAGANSIGLSYTSFSLTLIGGMSTATLLTLLVVPVFYTFFDDARETVASTVARALARKAAAGA